MIAMLFQDPRDYQLIFLVFFLFIGIYSHDLTLNLTGLVIVLLACSGTQILCLALSNLQQLSQNRQINPSSPDNSVSYQVTQFLSRTSLKSAMITALGLGLLLRTNSPITMGLAGSLAIGSKFLLRWGDKHFFNPANFGIIATLTLTNDAWVSPGQWGNSGWYVGVFVATGALILKRVGRWETTAAFLITYISLEAVYYTWLGWSFDVLLHQIMRGSLLLFAFFMITDPRSIPNHNLSRLIWAILLGMISWILQDYFYLKTAPFWALFMLSPLTLLFDTFWPASQFSWQVFSVSPYPEVKS
jgi:Na+-transporting NADH:ubiquinone oxidoreductase subunit NqrB